MADEIREMSESDVESYLSTDVKRLKGAEKLLESVQSVRKMKRDMGKFHAQAEQAKKAAEELIGQAEALEKNHSEQAARYRADADGLKAEAGRLAAEKNTLELAVNSLRSQKYDLDAQVEKLSAESKAHASRTAGLVADERRLSASIRELEVGYQKFEALLKR